MNLEKNNLIKKINETKKNALSTKEYYFLNSEIVRLLEKDVRGILTKEDESYLEEILKKISSSEISVETISEFKILLEKMGVGKDDLHNMLSHENAHANKAEQLGGEEVFKRYNLAIIRNPILKRLLPPFYRKYFIEPSATIEIPDSFSEQEKREFITQVANAPEEYGNTLAKSDTDIIDKIK